METSTQRSSAPLPVSGALCPISPVTDAGQPFGGTPETTTILPTTSPTEPYNQSNQHPTPAQRLYKNLFKRRRIHGTEIGRSSGSLKDRLKEACEEVTDLYHGLPVLETSYATMDDVLNTHWPLKLQPWSAQRQEIEDAQQDLAVTANIADQGLRRLADDVEELENIARRECPELVRDVLLLEQAVSDAHFDYSCFQSSLGHAIFRDSDKRRGIFTEDRPGALNGPPPDKQPINDRPAQLQRIRTNDFDAHNRQQAERNLQHDYRTNPLSVRFSDLFEKDFEIVDAIMSLEADSRRFERLSSRYTRYSHGIPRHTELLKLADELLGLALPLRQRVEEFGELQRLLRQDYGDAIAGPSHPDINKDMQHYELRNLDHVNHIDSMISKIKEFQTTEPVLPPGEGTARRDFYVLDGVKLSLRPHLIKPNTLQTSACECQAIGDEDQDHHYWYKGLHPLAPKLHAYSHEVKQLNARSDSFDKRTCMLALLSRAKKPSQQELETHSHEAAKCKTDICDLCLLYLEEPALENFALEAEIGVLYRDSISMSLRAEDAFLLWSRKHPETRAQ